MAALLFADDILLLSETKKGMDRLLAIAAEYARKWRFSFNAEKSAIMVFGESKRNAQKKRSWKLGHLELEERESYTYLGAEVEQAGIREKHLIAAAKRAISGAERLRAVGVISEAADPNTAKMLLDVLLLPILNNAAGVVPIARTEGLITTTGLVDRHLKQLGRKVIGVGRNEIGTGVLYELKTLGAEYQHGAAILNFYGFLQTLPPTRLARKACEDAMAEGSKSKWGETVRYWAQTLELSLPGALDRSGLVKWKTTVKNAVLEHSGYQVLQDIAASPRQLPLALALSDAASVRRFWINPQTDPLAAWDAPLVKLVRALRLGCLPLRDSLRQHGLTEEVVCPMCGRNRETALHFLVECEAYEPDREVLMTELDLIAGDDFFLDLEKAGSPRLLQWMLQLPTPGCRLPGEVTDMIYQAFAHFLWNAWGLRRLCEEWPEKPVKELRAARTPLPTWRFSPWAFQVGGQPPSS